MTGDIFRGYLLDGSSTWPGADRAGHPAGRDDDRGRGHPFLSDRDLALRNVRYVLDAAGALGEDFQPAPDGFIATRANTVLGEAIDLLHRIERGQPADRDRRGHVRPNAPAGRPCPAT